ncbi:Arylsulfatase [Chamberlinius hualienensis]
MSWKGALSTLLLFCSVSSKEQSKPKQPNIIFVLADDLGWNDVGFRNPDIITPHIDNAALNGIILDSSYVQPVCTPTRASIMTGYYPFRTGMQAAVILFFAQMGLPLQFKLLPETLQELGYSTHLVGKWHLGSCNQSYLPTNRGFDDFFGFLSGAEHFYTHSIPLTPELEAFSKSGIPEVYDFWNQSKVSTEYNGTYSSIPYLIQIENILNNKKEDQPLFLYYTLQSTHVPNEVPRQQLLWYPTESNPYRKGYSALATQMDDDFGQFINMLKKHKIYDNSIIIFTADNGGEVRAGANNYPLKGGKTTLYEGGTRAAAFIHSPLLKNTGFKYDGLIHAVDWNPTIVSLAGGSPNSKMDGKNVWEAITRNKPSPRTEFIYNLDNSSGNLSGAIRYKDWKLIFGNAGLPNTPIKPANVTGELFNACGGRLSPDPNPPPYQLYNILSDRSESKNLASTNSEILQLLQSKLLWFATMLALLVLCILSAEVSAHQKPHIIFAIADDLGWNDVGFHNPEMRTPYIDAAAYDGIILNQSYVQSICTPSRASWLTGYYPYKTGMQTALGFFSEWGLPLQFKLLPETLKTLGYATHIIGKWHLGSCNASYLPTNRGFDTFFGYLAGGEHYYRHSYPLTANDSSDDGNFSQVYDFWNQSNPSLEYNGTYSSIPFLTQLQNTLEKRDPDVPLFLYMAFQNTHSPIEVDQQYSLWYPREKNPYRQGFSALASQLDTNFGQVVNMLKDYGIYNESIIIFTSDNGGEVRSGGNNYPLRGGKTTNFEGGTRASAFIHSQLLKHTGFTYNGLIHAVDWYPTIVGLAGGRPDPAMDGVNLWHKIINNYPSARKNFVYALNKSNGTLVGAIRDKNWKLIFGNPGYPNDIIKPEDVSGELYNTCGGLVLFYNDSSPPQLYNIDDDPTESNNLASVHKVHYTNIPSDAIKIYGKDNCHPVGGLQRFVTPSEELCGYSIKPHIIFVIVDDLGWNDVGFHNPDLRTPNIDNSAKWGIILNSSYVQPTCTPSRATVLTGYYPHRTGMTNVIPFFANWGLPLQFKILPEEMKKLGYSTHIIGKWHIGSCNASYLPTNRGFDTFFGFLGGAEYFYTHGYQLSNDRTSNLSIPQVYDFWNQTNPSLEYNGTYSSFPFLRQAESIFESRDQKVPLFMYMAYQATHSPVEIYNDSDLLLYSNQENPFRKNYSALVTQLDRDYGQLIDLLKKYGIYNESIIIFTGDNGGETRAGGNNYPLKGDKTTLYEGGTRAAAFIHSPLLNKSGYTYNGLIHAVDWFPTITALAGGKRGKCKIETSYNDQFKTKMNKKCS